MIRPAPRCTSSPRFLRLSWPLLCVLAVACSSEPKDEPDARVVVVDAAPPPPVDAAPIPPLFSHTRGFYTDPFELILSPPYPFAEVYYTLDGRDPTGPDAMLYDAPISVDTTSIVRAVVTVENEPISASVTHSFFFADHVRDQQAPAEYPTEWWAHHATGPWPSDYEMDPDVIDDPRAAGRFPDVFLQATTVSVTLDPDDLFGPGGIHENAWLGGSLWERAGSLEIFEPQDPADQIQVNCAISIHGASSRQPDRTTKKSFRAEFKSAYGPGKLNYKVFDDSPIEEFDVLVLRGGYNRTWTHFTSSQRDRAQYVREAFVAELYREMGHTAPRAKHAHMFLNGLYWGLTWIQERPNAAFQASYFGGSKSDYDTLNSGRVVNGDRVAWDHMMTIVDFGLDDPAVYAALQEWLDIVNLADYMLVNQWSGNVDWPDRNWYAGRRRAVDAKFQFFTWDSEITLGNTIENIIDRDFPDTPGYIFTELRQNPEFVTLFGDRVHRHCFNDGVLTPTATVERWNRIAAIAEPLVYAESARWGDHARDLRGWDTELYTPWEHWLDEQDRLRSVYFPTRNDIAVQHYRDAGLYPLTDAPTLNQFGGSVPAGFMLDMTGAAADRDIYYTLDGSDPRLPGGAIAGTAMVYSGPIVINGNMPIKARIRTVGGEWSALVDTAFTVQ